LDALLRQQNKQNGGFHTHYRWDEPQLADPNIEATATALLALHTLRPKLHLLVRDPAAWAVDYLHSQYNPEIGLLRESVETAQYHYWLTTDNQLAIYALRAAGETALPDRLAASIEAYGGARHGVIESLSGDVIETWPPYTETQTIVAMGNVGERCPKSEEVSAPVICRETRLTGNQYPDWEQYSDWLLYAALRAHQQGDVTEARVRYQQALDQFDGLGFADLAAKDGDEDGKIVHYATYKLALALYVGAQLGKPLREDLLSVLLQKQALSGGFHTLYQHDGTIVGDTNTETTSYALLALLAVEHYAMYLPQITR
jgi:hypothetical protein